MEKIVIRFENVSLRYGHPLSGKVQGLTGSLIGLSRLIGCWTNSRSFFKTAAVDNKHAYQPEILHDLDFHLPSGSFHFITGVSGAGKSSLLKLIYLALKPTRGEVFLDGQALSQLKGDERAVLRRQIGVIFQDYRLFEHLNLYENVVTPLVISGLYDREAHEDALDLLTWVGLGDKLYAYPRTLSGGQKQRTALARAVIMRPRILLADEPTGNLDDGMGLRLVHLFEELHHIGTTVLIATHNHHLLEAFPYPQIRLSAGKATVEKVPGRS